MGHVGVFTDSGSLDDDEIGFMDAFEPIAGISYYHFAGFLYELEASTGGTPINTYSVGVPMWFLMSLVGMASAYMWRKAGRSKPGGAFPVEIDKISPERRPLGDR